MKKRALFAAGLLAFGAATFTACKDDEEEPLANISENEAVNTEYNSSYAKQWGNYMRVVATLLKTDSDNLYNYWNTAYDGGDSYAKRFLGYTGAGFQSSKDCVEQIIDGCVDIAGEVGDSKIKGPVDTWNSGKHDDAVLQVESWFSWHSRVDFSNNIASIKNAYYGSLDGVANANSISKVINGKNAELDAKVIAAIKGAQDAILAIPQPFRNNLGSTEAQAAIEACGELSDVLENDLKGFIDNSLADYNWDAVLNQYVNGVILPTYKSLSEKNTELYNAVVAFEKNPSNEGFSKCADAWLAARNPWESSEAFLFGPVADKGLDPNMDTWPLDLSGIVKIFNTASWGELEWSGDYEEQDEDHPENSSKQANDIAAAQGLRGFHTLEYLIFKDGKARTIH
ncbi:MAG: peptidase M75 [Bacteroidales bacterium]|nr:peptidase M75 [Bacteroidales bacterium]